ncbi:ABC transporter permease subunit [Paenibacillus sp. J5C_2022]|uniref:ABC transporter permease n=1 Tax=Paenibacillus sp. J5C2022 TaxID=2977129 RepID=UPI0021D1FCDF|nr:ABC transporter permease subunit [Paenibacillus sp. J5C2022]MCU6708548.1 ABC transporter permease subunit [Paenibacillus sp. J5C2022]
MKFSHIRSSIIRDRYLYIMLVPFLLWYIIFQFKPLYGLQIAFKDFSVWKGIADSPWVGWKNFITFFDSPYFIRTLRNTLIINFYQLIFAFPVPIALALLLNEIRNALFKKTVQTLTYLPHFISVVVVAGIVTNFLAPSNGIVNLIISMFGGEKIYFLTQPEYFRTIFIASMDIWKEAGFNTIVYLAAVTAVNPALYEAAVMDGANRWKQTIHVTLPAMMPTIAIMLILKIGSMMEVSYEAIILLYQPSTYETADVISTYVYRSGLQEGQYDLATAVGLFNGLVGLILVVFANRASKKLTETGLW